ncbi:thiamine-phosphate kinase [bacterium]|nr:thiamine-phosphate kinase [bacterium]
MFENKEKTNLESLGEFGLISHITKDFDTKNASTYLGVGDDAALLKFGDTLIAISTDMLVENIHFDLMYTPLLHLGYKAVCSNLSDICAMNAKPTQVTVSLSLSSKFTLEAVEELYKGVKAACDKYKVDLVGGDTTSSPKGLSISVTAIGTVEEENVVKRTGAKDGDLLCVTGDLGGAYMGLQILEREKRVFLEHPEMQPDIERFDYIVGRQLKPEARLDVLESLKEMKVKPTSMIDISDGLASEIFHLCKASDVGMKLYEDKIPIDPLTYQTALDLNLDPTVSALNGGEDYELLFTVNQTDFETIRNSADISIIGHCVPASEGKRLITKSGNEHELIAQGWQSF